jgi:hypothetical protein
MTMSCGNGFEGKYMKWMAILWLMLFCSVISLIGQSKGVSHPDFSGSWTLNASASKIPGFEFEVKKDVRLEIRHVDPSLIMMTKEKRGNDFVETDNLTYFTDNRGEVNHRSIDGKVETVTSNSKWDGRKLVVIPGGNTKEKETKEEWTLSSDGNTLTHKIRITLRSTFTTEWNGKPVDTRTNTDKIDLILVFDKVQGLSK